MTGKIDIELDAKSINNGMAIMDKVAQAETSDVQARDLRATRKTMRLTYGDMHEYFR